MAATVLEIRYGEALPPDQAELIGEAVRAGQVLIFPTDTVYGLGSHAFDEEAVQRTYRIKGRPPERPFSVHLGGAHEIERYARVTHRQRALIEKLLPGPYTVILEATGGAPPACISPEGKIGLRVPDSRSFRRVYGAGGRALVGTSVNRSGEPPLTEVEAIIDRFSDEVDLMVATDEPMSRASSTVVDLTTLPPKVLRGRLPEELLRE